MVTVAVVEMVLRKLTELVITITVFILAAIDLGSSWFIDVFGGIDIDALAEPFGFQ